MLRTFQMTLVVLVIYVVQQLRVDGLCVGKNPWSSLVSQGAIKHLLSLVVENGGQAFRL